MNPLSHTGRCRSQKGFTLIEIIAVLVILGVLSAVAAPKFIGLKTEAENRAALQAVMEAQNRLTNQYAIRLMTSESEANDLSGLFVSASIDAGDYRLSFAVTGSEIEITASGIPEKGVSGTARGIWRNW